MTRAPLPTKDQVHSATEEFVAARHPSAACRRPATTVIYYSK
jgi:hypothetical protein